MPLPESGVNVAPKRNLGLYLCVTALAFFLFLQSPALERCQRMKKQLSKLGETTLRYFFILNAWRTFLQ